MVQDAATGISLRVTNAYADATGTAVQLETSNAADQPLAIWEPQLAFAPGGRTLQQAAGACGGTPSCLVVYTPVAPAESAPLVHFVASSHFRVQHSNVFQPGGTTPTPTPGWLTGLDQLALSVPFALAPVRSRGYTYQQAPTVKQGIGVQAEWLQVAPAANAFYGPAGGASVELQFSGLPANMEILSFLRIAFQNHICGGTTGNAGPGSVDLTIPGMTVSDPAFTVLQDPPIPPPDPQVREEDLTIGAAGTAQLEVVFQGSGLPTGQPATVSISNIQLLAGGIDGNSGNPPTLPSYQITLPMP